MKNILNNPIVVVLLSVIALGYLGYTLKPLFLDDSVEGAFVDEEALPEIFDVSGSQQDRGAAPELIVNNASIDLRVKPRRNPFLAVKDESTLALTKDDVKLFRQSYLNLNAIIISNNLRLARVNDELLGVGDAVDEYQIMLVEANYIDVKGPDGLRRITLEKSNQE